MRAAPKVQSGARRGLSVDEWNGRANRPCVHLRRHDAPRREGHRARLRRRGADRRAALHGAARPLPHGARDRPAIDRRLHRPGAALRAGGRGGAGAGADLRQHPRARRLVQRGPQCRRQDGRADRRRRRTDARDAAGAAREQRRRAGARPRCRGARGRGAAAGPARPDRAADRRGGGHAAPRRALPGDEGSCARRDRLARRLRGDSGWRRHAAPLLPRALRLGAGQGRRGQPRRHRARSHGQRAAVPDA